MSNNEAIKLALLALVLAASIRDLATRRIPNSLLLTGLLAALLLHIFSAEPLARLGASAAGFALGLIMFLPFYCLRGMAAGDVKLMATVGAFTGPAIAFQIALATCVAGGVMCVVIVIAQGHTRAALTNMLTLLRPAVMRLLGVPLVNEPLTRASVGNIPYGVAIAIGTLAVLWIHHS
jgi:prepilin peptidase CpaA